MIQIQWTCATIEEARKIVRLLLDEKLIACASLISSCESIYQWEGKIESSYEVKVFFKTQKRHFEAVSKKIRAHCSYEVPELLSFHIEDSSPAYAEWVKKSTQTSKG
jgi:periplasmic divalent cation tolerance protein